MATRSSTIDAVLKPLVAEARRRRSVYSRRSIYGPLADLRVDLTGDRAAPVIGQEPPAQVESKLSDPRKEAHPTPSPSPTPRVRTVSRSNSTTRRLANANTLRLRRQPSLNIPTYRSFPAAENSAVQSQLSSTSAVSSAGGIPMARPRASLTPQRSGSGVSARRLARSAHLHTIQADLMRDQARHGIQQQAKASTSAAMSGDGANTPRGPPSQVDLIPAVSGGPIASSPIVQWTRLHSAMAGKCTSARRSKHRSG